MHLSAVEVNSLAGRLFLVSRSGGFHWKAHQEEEVEEQRRESNKAATDVDLAVVSEGFSLFFPSYSWFRTL